MRKLVRVSVLLPVLLALIEPTSLKADPGTPSLKDIRKRSDDDFLVLLWCLSHFPRKGESAKPVPRPVGKLRPFDPGNAVAPPDLITKTETIGELPSSIEQYRGVWTYPTIHGPSPGAVFVERLTPTEMTITVAVRRDLVQNDKNNKNERVTLSWTGTHFSHSKVTAPEDIQRTEAYLSQSGEAMLIISMGSRLPACFISEKYY